MLKLSLPRLHCWCIDWTTWMSGPYQRPRFPSFGDALQCIDKSIGSLLPKDQLSRWNPTCWLPKDNPNVCSPSTSQRNVSWLINKHYPKCWIKHKKFQRNFYSPLLMVDLTIDFYGRLKRMAEFSSISTRISRLTL